MSHDVRVPAGWRVLTRTLYAQAESTELEHRDGNTCAVTVWRDGQFDPDSDVGRRLDITIGGRPGFTGSGSAEGSPTLYWSYRDAEWASVRCSTDDEFATATTMATRTVFTPTSLQLPIRLSAAPEGYRVTLVCEQHSGTGRGYLSLDPIEGGSEVPNIHVGLARGESKIQPHIPGYEADTVAGRPAVLQAASGSLDLMVDGHLLGIQASGGSGRDPARWPTGRRELLVQVAESLELAPDLADRSTWFDARDAVPG